MSSNDPDHLEPVNRDAERDTASTRNNVLLAIGGATMIAFGIGSDTNRWLWVLGIVLIVIAAQRHHEARDE